jgi:hypothetical protein
MWCEVCGDNVGRIVGICGLVTYGVISSPFSHISF